MTTKTKVQCAGGGWWLKPEGKTVVQYSRERGDLGVDLPCGWVGRRTDVYHPSGHPEVQGYWGPNLSQPCPRCSGKVQLIRPTQEVEPHER